MKIKVNQSFNPMLITLLCFKRRVMKEYDHVESRFGRHGPHQVVNVYYSVPSTSTYTCKIYECCLLYSVFMKLWAGKVIIDTGQTVSTKSECLDHQKHTGLNGQLETNYDHVILDEQSQALKLTLINNVIQDFVLHFLPWVWQVFHVKW